MCVCVCVWGGGWHQHMTKHIHTAHTWKWDKHCLLQHLCTYFIFIYWKILSHLANVQQFFQERRLFLDWRGCSLAILLRPDFLQDTNKFTVQTHTHCSQKNLSFCQAFLPLSLCRPVLVLYYALFIIALRIFTHRKFWLFPLWNPVCDSRSNPAFQFTLNWHFTFVLSHRDFSHGKFGLLSLGKASCDRVARPNLKCMLGVLVFP